MMPLRSRQLIQRENDFCCTPALHTQPTIPDAIWKLKNDERSRAMFITRARLLVKCPRKSNFRFQVGVALFDALFLSKR